MLPELIYKLLAEAIESLVFHWTSQAFGFCSSSCCLGKYKFSRLSREYYAQRDNITYERKKNVRMCPCGKSRPRLLFCLWHITFFILFFFFLNFNSFLPLFIICLLFAQTQYTCIVVSELLTYTPTGNDFLNYSRVLMYSSFSP